MHPERVQAVTVHAFEQRRAVPHEPDHQLALGPDSRVHRCVFRIGRLAALLEDEIKLWMRLGTWVDFARPHTELVTLWLGIVEVERRVGRVESRRGSQGYGSHEGHKSAERSFFHQWVRIVQRAVH